MIADETEKLEKAIARRMVHKPNHSITIGAINRLENVESVVDEQIAELKRQDAYELLHAGE